MTTVTEIAHLRDRIVELLEELNKERDLIAAMREHIERAHEQVERSNQTVKQWIEGFEMTPTDKGWAWEDDLIECYIDLANKYNDLVKKWNRYIGSLKTRRAIGRPLQASEVQQARVRKLRRVGHTLREIANETNLSFQTIRTILGRKSAAAFRTDKTRNKLRKIELNHHRMYSWRARNRTGDAQINAVLKDGENLLKDGRDLLQK
jgi:hypothetical protein